MRNRIALCLASVLVACGGDPIPTQPSGTSGSGTTGAPTVTSLSIRVPATVALGETVQFSATARLSDGSTADYTDKVQWVSQVSSILFLIRSGGLATGYVGGEVNVSAHVIWYGPPNASTHVMVLPTGTYRLNGEVRESGLPVGGATVAVISGRGTGLSTVTDSGGGYWLYGVEGPVEIQVSKSGFDTVVRGLTVSSTEVASVTDIRQTEVAPLAGAYSLTLTAAGNCTALPVSARSRTYLATVVQSGPVLQVTLSGADFYSGRNQFSGRVTPQGVTFLLEEPEESDLAEYLPVIERFSPTAFLSFYGFATTTIASSGISGSFNGAIGFVNPQSVNGPLLQPSCSGPHQFSLTPLAPR